MTQRDYIYKTLMKIVLCVLLVSTATEMFSQTTLFSETFESAGSVNTPTSSSGYNGWRRYTVTAGTSLWKISNSSSGGCVLSGSWSAMMCSGAFSCHYGADDPSGYYFSSSNNILYHTVTTTGYSSIKINFKWEAGGESGADYGKVCWSTNGTSWTDLSGTYLDQTSTQTVSNLALPSGADNQATLYIGWRWRNDNNYVPEFEQGFSIDDITITGVATCTGTPSAPVATAATNVGVNSFTANWNASANANAYYLDVSTSNTFSTFVSGYNNRSVGNVTTYSVTGLSANTTYYYRVRAKCTGTSSNSNTISTTTALNYCSTTALTSPTGYGITNVTFNTINNTTGINGGYVDYTGSISTSVSPGLSYNLSVRATTGGAYTFYQKAWIDWNQDGTFNTSTEEYALGTIYNATGGLSSACPYSITVPASAVLGETRMRVISRYSTYASPCQTGSYSGEVEDYTIVVSNPPGQSYGIYAPGAVSTISDCEIYAQGGAGTSGCLVCSPTDAGYTNVNISDYPVVNATNISCTSTNITLSTSASSPDWTGSSSPLTGTGASKTTQYTTTGRKNVKLTTTAACPSSTTYSATANVGIPDNGCSVNTYAYSTITVPSYGSCKVNTANMSIKININHNNDADLLIYLKAPNNKLLCVSTGNGGTGNNYTNTIFSDGAATNIIYGSAPFTGTYKPEGSTGSAGCATPTSGVTTLGTLGGSSYNPSGNWTLYVLDEASGTSGTLVDWSLTLPAASGTGGSVSYTYTGFTNMMMSPPSAGSVQGTLNGCPGTYAYSSSAAGTPGFTYSWSVSPSAGTSITSSTSSSTNITFPNSSGTYTITCNETSQCCGPLTAITYTTTISAPPVAPSISVANSSPCVGSSTTLTATAPANASFAWYDASTGGNLLGTGSSYTTPAVAAGANTYYVEALNTAGCSSSPRTAVIVTGTATTAPTISGITRCGSGSVTLDITSPVAGYTYSWYSSCGGTLLQSNTSISYTANVTTTTTFYVTATAPGCAASSCTAVTVTVNAIASSLTWTGSAGGANNWFNPANWGGCIPTCATDVSIPSTANPPDIGYNASGGAACKNINLQSSATLSFSDAKAELSVCGNVTHNGTVTSNNKGTLIFNGTSAQTYTKGGSASGDFNDVLLNNTAGTPTLTLSSDLTLAAGGSFTFQSGMVITGANNLIIKNTEASAISGYNSSRYVQGNLRRYINTSVPTSYDFPVGTSAKGYQLANVNFTTAPASITYLTAFFSAYGSLPSALGSSECYATYNQSALNNGYWDISANTANNNSGVYTMTLYNANYTNAYNGFTVMSLHGAGSWGILNGDGSGSQCVASPVTAVVRRGMKGFSKFGTAQSLSVLPIELLKFDAIYNGKSTDVNWSTASETNNHYFIVERSLDAEHFTNIGKVLSKAKGGNSTSLLTYTLNDPDVTKGIYYYRLRQMDFDGRYTQSGIVAVTIDDNIAMLTVTPNPTQNTSELSFESAAPGPAELKIYDTRGRLVLSKELDCTKGRNSYMLDLNKEISGMFYIILKLGDSSYSTKLLKQ